MDCDQPYCIQAAPLISQTLENAYGARAAYVHRMHEVY